MDRGVRSISMPTLAMEALSCLVRRHLHRQCRIPRPTSLRLSNDRSWVFGAGLERTVSGQVLSYG